jgi:hypothetical protein
MVHHPVCGDSSQMSRRPESEGFRGMVREVPWLEVGVNDRQLDRSCCGVLGAAVGSMTHFGNSPNCAATLDKILLGDGVVHTDSALPLVLAAGQWKS